MEPKEKVSASIQQAQARLDQALEELEHLPSFDPGSIAFAAHALHNYLTVISGTAQLISRALEGTPNPDVQRWLQGLLRTTEVMEHTVNQMMGTGAGSGPSPAKERVELPHLLRRVAAYYERLAARKRLRIAVETGAAVPPAMGDRLGVAATLDNLISNAVKFSNPGTTITLSVHARPGGVVCSVKDEGPGLSPEDQTKLFQRGTRLTPKPTAGEPSTGYGLAVAKDLIEKQGGRIWCESRLGHGAQFSFELPLFPEPAPAGATPKT